MIKRANLLKASMHFIKTQLTRALALAASAMLAQPAFAQDKLIDRASLEIGGGDKVQMVRFGAQADWSKRWFEKNGWHLGGYWDASLAQWRGTAYRNVDGQHQNITNIGFTPVFRYQADNLKGWYAEGGIGVNLLSELYNNDDNRFSTAFQFGDHIGAGYVFDNKWELGMKIQHFSNASIKRPNSGANFLLLKASYKF